MKQVGITETYDPCFVIDWETKLLDANIVISKELSDEMIEKLLVVGDRVIFHHTVTGQGNTVLEPNVRVPEYEFEQFRKLIARGFPYTHYVLRLDPINHFYTFLPIKYVFVISCFIAMHCSSVSKNCNLMSLGLV